MTKMAELFLMMVILAIKPRGILRARVRFRFTEYRFSAVIIRIRLVLLRVEFILYI